MEKSSDGNRNWGTSTICIHTGAVSDQQHKGVVSPLYPATAYNYLDVDIHAYPRYFNTPNMIAVSAKIAALEKGERALVYGSGMAAIYATLFSLLSPGDHAIFQNDLYGGTHHAVTSEMKRMGILYTFIDSVDEESLVAALTPQTKLVYVETPSNPLLKIIDLSLVSKFARAHDLISVIDNTFASPINQNPIPLGIDVVIHSGTKYLGGHSDILSGAIVTSEALIGRIREHSVNFGGNLNAQMCHLLERSLLTLALRVRQINQNAMEISEFLYQHPKVDAVYYPGLSSHPGHDIAKRQMAGFGGMLSFEVSSDPDEFVRKLSVIRPAMSLGGVESTITSPRLTSHAKIGAEGRQKVGISDNLLRFSVGIEDAADLIRDLDSAL
ncbi:trans-sulfuration enzyme family protein [Fulvivirga sedimenti]|uniref:PLP-dependent aspartate aminotransferase family protein n=1 Tax=Fulvivirga sedimenti TaxID=2879465 RepID=A0A9X1HV11_9BACT|nr:PLP-dependent aspartate aminotransferase family protein [Fulvivirga sedimenti]MCA6078420.1 PLP-dependent aspartate aminotransferase family protein [Fulvivirga sedimenti]